MTKSLAATDLRRALLAAEGALRDARSALDAMNVFPVPDADTGTNLLLTFEAIADAVRGPRDDAAAIAHAARSGALMGARGNSGVIFSQIVRAWADAVEVGPASPEDVARAFKRAVELAYEAVLEPAEGTILTVLRAASEAAQSGGASVAARFGAAARAAVEALARTPEQMDLLARAGVVDAGAAGFTVVLAAMAAELGDPVEVRLPRQTVATTACGDPSSFAFEVMYMLEAPDEVVPALRALLGTIGDSVAVVGGAGSWRIHVHTDEPDRARAFGEGVGLVSDVLITSFAEQIAGQRGVQLERAERGAALIVIVDGEGNATMLRDLGAVVVEQILDLPATLRNLKQAHVIVVPCDARAREAALSLADAVAHTMHVLPVLLPAAALGIAAAYGEARSVDDCLADMHVLLARVRSHAVDSLEETLRIIAEAGEGSELITVVTGMDVEEAERERLAGAVAEAHPHRGVEVLHGGQRVPSFSVAIE